MESVYRDFSYGLKSFSRNPLFAGVFVAALAIGIGATISVFTVIDALVLRPLPVPHPEQLVDLTANYRGHSRIPISYPMFAELERRQHAFTNICGWTAGGAFSVGIHGNVSLSDVRSVTGNYYSVLGASPLLGRLINPGDAQVSQAVARCCNRLRTLARALRWRSFGHRQIDSDRWASLHHHWGHTEVVYWNDHRLAA